MKNTIRRWHYMSCVAICFTSMLYCSYMLTTNLHSLVKLTIGNVDMQPKEAFLNDDNSFTSFLDISIDVAYLKQMFNLSMAETKLNEIAVAPDDWSNVTASPQFTYLANICASLIGIVASFSLLYALHKLKPEFIYPYLIAVMLQILYKASMFVVQLVMAWMALWPQKQTVQLDIMLFIYILLFYVNLRMYKDMEKHNEYVLQANIRYGRMRGRKLTRSELRTRKRMKHIYNRMFSKRQRAMLSLHLVATSKV